ncbi:MAG TPA: peroxiredoxin [Kiritimatiellia bacterium]|nr:peroxiredoxin [Kiritimatiellia bacterium]
MKLLFVMTVVLAMGVVAASALQPGDAAPDFKAMSTTGSELSLADYAGSWLVLYFYPKSFTPGCTAQGCSLRDGFSPITEAGAKILGVSVDKLETQQKFKAEHKLPFELLADADADVAKAYGVSTLMGKMARRVTFIITPDGKIGRVMEDIKTGSHDAQVLEALKALQTGDVAL